MTSGEAAGEWPARSRPTGAHCTWPGVSTDHLYPLRLSEQMVAARTGSELSVIESRYGHDGFLIETDQVGAVIARALGAA